MFKKASGVAGLCAVSAGVMLGGGATAFAATPGDPWTPVDAQEASPAGVAHSAGWVATGVFNFGDADLVGYNNVAPNADSKWAFCIIAGLPSSTTADQIDAELDKLTDEEEMKVAYAVTTFGVTDDVTQLTAVSWWAHRYGDLGSANYTGGGATGKDERRERFANALAGAPQEVKDKVAEIQAGWEAYQANPDNYFEADLDINRRDNFTGTMDVKIPGTTPLNVTLSDGVTFEDGSTSKVFNENTNGVVINTPAGATVSASGKAVEDIRIPGKTLHTYRQSGTHPTTGKEYQVMAYASPDVQRPQATAEGYVASNPQIGTTATDKADGDKLLPQSGGTLTDEVSYTDLTPGTEYTVNGTIMDKTTNAPLKDANGNDVVSTATFTPTEPNGTVSLDFTIPAINEATDLVAFETLLQGSRELTTHADINDEGQTVRVPGIGTTALDKLDQDKYVNQSGGTVVDTVEYKNLLPGKEYTVTGTLKNKDTGEDVVDENGTPVTGSTTFTPENASGTVDVEIPVPATEAPATMVAFERLEHEGVEYAVHADINDEGQTFFTPGLKTTATDASDGDHYLAQGESQIVDTVEYTNLTPGKEYNLKARLMNKETGEAVVNPDGSPVTGELTFTPESANGTVDVPIIVPAQTGANAFVVFEDAYEGDNLFVSHADINDEGQTVYTPELKTTATDQADGDHYLNASGGTIVDTVEYTNLTPGKEYTVKGSLMDKDTGEAAVDADGNPILGETTFTPESATGTVDVTFEIPAQTESKSFVVFEDAYEGDVLFASHADIDDEGQTVYTPGIGTTATDKVDGDHYLAQSGSTIVDTVEYKNLMPGKTYQVSGVLMNKETGEPFLDDEGNQIVASQDFTPETASGTYELEFVVPALKAPATLVAFEAVKDGDAEVAVHADINDEAQTTYVAHIGTTATDKADGDKEVAYNGTIVDTVDYTNLLPGKEYTLDLVMMDKATNAPAVDADGKPVTATATFTPTEASGSTTVEVNLKGVNGKDLTAFETLTDSDGTVTAEHKDITSAEQSVKTTTPPEKTTTPPTPGTSVKTGAGAAGLTGLGTLLTALGGLGAMGIRRLRRASH